MICSDCLCIHMCGNPHMHIPYIPHAYAYPLDAIHISHMNLCGPGKARPRGGRGRLRVSAAAADAGPSLCGVEALAGDGG